eukprot:4289961-Karenia_brevis.AAC.1
MKCSSVHSSFHVARATGTLTIDPLTKEIHKLVQTMSQKKYSRDEQLKGAALAAYTTSTDVAKDFTKAARDSKDLA